MGALPEGIEPLLNIARHYPTLISYLSPTHLIRTEALFMGLVVDGIIGGLGAVLGFVPQMAILFLFLSVIVLFNSLRSHDSRNTAA